MKNNDSSSENELLLKQYYSRYGGFWVYPGMLDYCYLVNPYFNRSKIVDEMEANFRTLLSEYPSGMGVNSKLASECWGIKQEYIIPGNGAAELIKVFMESLEGKVGVVRPTFEEYPNRLPDDQVVTYVPQNEDFRYGADELIDTLAKTFIEPGDEFIVPLPSYMYYEYLLKQYGANPVYARWDLDKNVLDVESIFDCITPKTKMIFLCSPNNPTGTLIDKKDLIEIGIPLEVVEIIKLVTHDKIDKSNFDDCIRYFHNLNELGYETAMHKELGKYVITIIW